VNFFNYRAFGLNIRSELEFGACTPGYGIPDVYVRLGSVPSEFHGAESAGVCFQAAPGRLLLNVVQVGRFLISDGKEIVVDAALGADPGMVFLLLFGSAFGALLHQRGAFVLHASAIATQHGAVVFAGASGTGKSTLAGAFYQRGFPVLADDVCVIDSGDCPVVIPANALLLLWSDVVDRLGLSGQNLRPARLGLAKFVLPLAERVEIAPTPLHAVYILEPVGSECISIVPIHGLNRIKTLSLNIYRPLFALGTGAGGQCFKQIGEVARQAKVASLRRPTGSFRLDELLDVLVADFET
jgi:hypothetical protein